MIALDPQQTFEVVPEVGLTAEPAVTVFVFRFGKASLQARLDELTDKADSEADLAKMRAMLAEGIGLFLKEVKPAMPNLYRLDRDAVKKAGTALMIVEESLEKAGKRYEECRAFAIKERVPAFQRICREELQIPGALVEDLTLNELEEVITKPVRLKKLATATAETLTDMDLVDLWDISNQLANGLRLTEIERKKSVLRSASAARRRSAGGAGLVGTGGGA